MAADLGRLLSAREVSEILGVAVGRIYELSRQNVLPTVRLGRQRRFSPEAIRSFIGSGGQALPGGWRREAGSKER